MTPEQFENHPHKDYCGDCSEPLDYVGHCRCTRAPSSPSVREDWLAWRDQVVALLKKDSLTYFPPWITMFQRGLTPAQAVVAATEFNTI